MLLLRTPLLALSFLALNSLQAPATAQDLSAVRIVGGLERPTSLTSAPGDPTRLFVTEEKRGISIIENGFLLPTRFLELFGTIGLTITGLTGLAFHPDYAQNGYFYVTYQDTSERSVLVRYQVSSDPNLADPASATVLLGPVQQPHVLHNWNSAQFGPDGMLYLACGDGGPGGDPNEHGQDLGVSFGKILRLDVDIPAPYVPPGNPFVGVPGAEPLIWAYGLRQPWRISFDRLTGDLWLADVGQATHEEINFQPASSLGGENYGWRCMEGIACTSLAGCGCSDPSWVVPIHDFDHTSGRCCVIGGAVYRGGELAGMNGRYLFGDYCSGQIWSLRYDGVSVTDYTEHTLDLTPCDGSVINGISSFGEDSSGEVYILDHFDGEVFKIVSGHSTAVPYCVGAPNSLSPGARIRHLGTTSVADNNFTISVTRAIPGQTGVFFYGPNQLQVPFGDGYRCAGGSVVRLKPVQTVNGQGTAENQIDLSAPTTGEPAILPGTSLGFQFWYRDPNGPGGTGFNLSNGLWVVFCP